MRIGIDVGGTNTDAVLMDGTTVIGHVKHSTSKDITGGIGGALTALQQQYSFSPSAVQAVMIDRRGTGEMASPVMVDVVTDRSANLDSEGKTHRSSHSRSWPPPYASPA